MIMYFIIIIIYIIQFVWTDRKLFFVFYNIITAADKRR